MCDQSSTVEELLKDIKYKSHHARLVALNSQYRRQKFLEKFENPSKTEETKEVPQETEPKCSLPKKPVRRYIKNPRSSSIDESRRYSCGSILARRASLRTPPKRNEIPVEQIVNQKKIEALQWQLREIERSRGMYKDLMKQIVIFLEKTHISLGHLGHRLNKKTTVPRAKSPHHADPNLTQKALIEVHVRTSRQKPELHPEEIPPEKLSQEAFRLLRTAQSLLNTQEPVLTSSEIPKEPSDLEFLAQVAKEFPSEGRTFKTSFSLSPKLILPGQDLKIQKAFNRKLSLQLSDVRRHSKEEECCSLPPGAEFVTREKEKLETPATGSISSTEDESGFSSMNSFQEIGLPLVNSTGIEEVSARSVLLRSMIHNNDYGSLSNDSDPYPSLPESTLTSSPFTSRRSVRSDNTLTDDSKRLSDVKLWQKPSTSDDRLPPGGEQNTRWPADSDSKSGSPSLKVLWV